MGEDSEESSQKKVKKQSAEDPTTTVRGVKPQQQLTDTDTIILGDEEQSGKPRTSKPRKVKDEE